MSCRCQRSRFWDPGGLGYQVLAVVEQQLDGQRALIEEGLRQRLDALPERSAGHGGGVDRIGLAALACAPARAGHELGSYAHHALAALDQEALEAARDVAAILDRPDALRVERSGPIEQCRVARAPGRDRLAASQLAARGLNSGHRVGGLVWIRADQDHLPRPFVG
jgi:hypothetical protein